MRITLDEVQARILLMLIQGRSLVTSEKRELIQIEKQLEELV